MAPNDLYIKDLNMGLMVIRAIGMPKDSVQPHIKHFKEIGGIDNEMLMVTIDVVRRGWPVKDSPISSAEFIARSQWASYFPPSF